MLRSAVIATLRRDIERMEEQLGALESKRNALLVVIAHYEAQPEPYHEQNDIQLEHESGEQAAVDVQVDAPDMDDKEQRAIATRDIVRRAMAEASR